MNSIHRILSAFLGTLVILIAFQNCGQPGGLTLSSQGTGSSKISTTSDPGLIVGPIDQPPQPLASQPANMGGLTPPVSSPPVNTDGPAPVTVMPPAAPLQCSTMGIADISLNVLEVKAPGASGASSHLFEIITNDSAVGSAHKIVVRALHSARKIDKIDLELAKTGSLMLAGNQETLLGVSTAGEGHKISLMLDRQDYTVTQGQLYTLSFKVDASKQAVKNTCEAKKCDSDEDDDDDKDDVEEAGASSHLQAKATTDKDDQDDDDKDDDDEHEGKKCVPKADECRLFLHLSEGSLKAGQ